MLSLVTGLFFPSKEREWKISVTFLLCMFGGLTVAQTWLTWGLFPVSLFFAGFATADDMQDTQKVLDKVQKSITEQTVQMRQDKNDLATQARRDKDEVKALLLVGQLNQIFDAMCGAIRNRRIDEANQWERQFTEKIIEYNRISMQVYPMRNCG